MSGSGTSSADLTRVITALQEMIRASWATQQALVGGLTISNVLTTTTVAGLPASAPVGTLRYASNGRNAGQGVGAGTGTLVVGSGSVWLAVGTGLAVTA